jgi:hypothetical protein
LVWVFCASNLWNRYCCLIFNSELSIITSSGIYQPPANCFTICNSQLDLVAKLFTLLCISGLLFDPEFEEHAQKLALAC